MKLKKVLVYMICAGILCSTVHVSSVSVMAESESFNNYGMNAGINLGCIFDKLDGHYIECANNVTEDTIKAIKKEGFDFIRCIVNFGPNVWETDNKSMYPKNWLYTYWSNSDRTAAENMKVEFKIKKDWLNKLNEVISWCDENNIKFVICVSNQMNAVSKGNNSYIPNFWAQPNELFKPYAERYLKNVWNEVSSYFQGKYSDTLVYELVNEPLVRKDNYSDYIYSDFSDVVQRTNKDINTGLTVSKDKRNVIQNNLSKVGFTFSSSMGYEDIWGNCKSHRKDKSLNCLKDIEGEALKVLRGKSDVHQVIIPTYSHSWDSESLDAAESLVSGNDLVGFHMYDPQKICANNINGSHKDISSVDFSKIKSAFDSISQRKNVICTEGAVESDERFVSKEVQGEWMKSINKIFIKGGIGFSLFDNGVYFNGESTQDKNYPNRQNSLQDYGFFDKSDLSWEHEDNINLFTDKSSSGDDDSSEENLCLNSDSITISNNSYQLKLGEKPGNCVVWSSSNSNVATVNNGLVSPVSKGNCIITAQYNGKKYVCKVTVEKEEKPVSPTPSVNIKLNRSFVELKKYSEKYKLLSNVSNVQWKSTDEDVAVVDKNGMVYGVGIGNCKIIAKTKDGNSYAICKVISRVCNKPNITPEPTATPTPVPTVEPTIAPVEVKMNKNVIDFYSKYTIQLSVGVKTDKWVSSDESVATVDSDGNVTPVGNGACIISAYVDGVEYICSIKVNF